MTSIRYRTRKYSLLIYTLYCALICATVAVLFFQFESRRDQALELMRQHKVQSVDQLNFTVKTGTDQINNLRILAENDLRQNMVNDKNSPLLMNNLLRPSNYFDGFAMDNLTSSMSVDEVGNLNGIGRIEEFDVGHIRELNMAYSLNAPFYAARKAIPSLAWVYYTSKRNFQNIAPWIRTDEAHFTDDLIDLEFYTLGLPTNNPNREIFWTDAYIDTYGKGLMVTGGAPIYEENEFLGTVALDITLDALNVFVRTQQLDIGLSFIANDNNQIIAHPTLTKSSAQGTRKLKDVLPEYLLDYSDRLMVESTHAFKLVNSDAWVSLHEIRGAPWSYVTYVSNRELRENILWKMIPEMFVAILFLLSLFGFEVIRRANYRVHEAKSVIEERTEELAGKEELLRLALDNMTDGMYMIDREGRFSLLNSQYKMIANLPDELARVGMPVQEIIKLQAERGDYGEGELSDQIETRFTALLNGEALTAEIHLGNGTSIVDVRKSPITNGGAVVTISDITERKQAELKLQNAFSNISSSIQYASRIQRAVLPFSSRFENITKDYFLIWEPRDVVGGDIYWCEKWGDGDLIVLGDCTGHGVPGAFMTLIATGALQRAIKEIDEGNVGELIQHMHNSIQRLLGQHVEQGVSDDGMELGVCYIQNTANILRFAGSRFDLFIADKGEVEAIKGTKKGIGYKGIPSNQTYNEHEIKLSGPQSFYMTSDGFIDQVGGEKHRMFGKKRFKALLEEVQGKSMEHQKGKILSASVEYQGNEARRDDVSLIGFRVK